MEFRLHLNIIKDLVRHPHVRIILLHPPYTKSQQKIIDSISRQSKHIIGQIVRKPPIIVAAQEIERLIKAHPEPTIPEDMIQYVIVGKQKPKNYN